MAALIQGSCSYARLQPGARMGLVSERKLAMVIRIVAIPADDSVRC